LLIQRGGGRKPFPKRGGGTVYAAPLKGIPKGRGALRWRAVNCFPGISNKHFQKNI